MNFYLDQNVLEASLDRIRRIFDEFETVYVSVSGGKDSTVIFHLAMQIAEEKGRLPLNVLFVDQEAEWEHTIEIIRSFMYDERVNPFWLQVPIKLFNATSDKENWLYCWEEGKQWMREKDPISIHENTYGTDRFHDMFHRFEADAVERNGGKPVGFLTGMRAEESPGRMLGMTTSCVYKDITWGRKSHHTKKAFTFHPIYDWSFSDIWKAIHEHGWPYNGVYDYMYQHGVKVKDMRISNLHHETSVFSLFILQEIEPDTYDRLTARLAGVDYAGKMGEEDYYITDLPYMFASWKEYRDYLLEHLIANPEHREMLRKSFEPTEMFLNYGISEKRLYRTHIQSILANDIYGTKMTNATLMWRLMMKNYLRAERKKQRELARRELQQG